MGEGEGVGGEACVVCCCVDSAWPAVARGESSLPDPAEEVVAALLSSRETLLGSPVVMALSSLVLSEGRGLSGSSVALSSVVLPEGTGLLGSSVAVSYTHLTLPTMAVV